MHDRVGEITANAVRDKDQQITPGHWNDPALKAGQIVADDARPEEESFGGRFGSGIGPHEHAFDIAHAEPGNVFLNEIQKGQRHDHPTGLQQRFIATVQKGDERFIRVVGERLDGGAGSGSGFVTMPQPIHDSHQNAVGQRFNEMQISGNGLTWQGPASDAPFDQGK